MRAIKMSRFIIIVISTGVLLFGFGCEQEQKGATSTPAVTAEPQPVQARPAVEPNNRQAVTEPSPGQPAESNSANLKISPASETSATRMCNMCTEFLSHYVDREGMINYRMLLRRKLELVTILDAFRTLDPNEYNSWSNDDKIAFWINGYNLNLIRIILDNYPIESTRVLRLFWPPNSIMHIKGVWDQYKFIIMDEEFTLKEIDERFLQKEFGDPRVFFAIYYGSISEPPLRNEAYYGDILSAQLDDQVKKFLAGPHAFRIDRQNQVVYLSSILQSSWHGQHFVAYYGADRKFKQQEPATRAVLNFLTKYISPGDTEFLETGNYTIQYTRYDWTLNDRSGP
jgi:hypothetical protein